MTNEEKLTMLKEMMDLETDSLTPDMLLADIEEWDSVAFISFIAIMDDEFGKIIKGAVLKEQKTVSDLMALMER